MVTIGELVSTDKKYALNRSKYIRQEYEDVMNKIKSLDEEISIVYARIKDVVAAEITASLCKRTQYKLTLKLGALREEYKGLTGSSL